MLLYADITVSIVCYQQDFNVLKKAIDSVISNHKISKIYIIDNSPRDSLKKFLTSYESKVKYLFVNKNIGFGSGHNLILKKIQSFSNYHLVLNPDTYFKSSILDKLVKELANNREVSLIAPKVLYPDDTFQYTVRKYPSIFEMFLRFFRIQNSFTDRREYRNENLEASFFPDFIYGSFMLFKTEDFLEIGGFDERYFLYMEDVDICKKIDKIGKKKMYYPHVHIYHVLKKGSSKNLKLFMRHTISMVKYFLKWGF